ncbi:MAG: hypothetical protein MI975_03625 [Cytophagales bacterium]|nr:hypothetical protein [Cytophagales bacterium]
MKYFFTAVLIFVLAPNYTKAAHPADWKEGVAVLNNKEVIKASMKLNQRYNVLLVKQHDQIKSIPASKIEKVTILNQELELLRTYICLPVERNSMKNYQFYELIITGKVRLLCREKDYKMSGEGILSDFFDKITPAQKKLVNDQDYFFYDGKNLILFNKFRKKVLPAFKRYFDREITAYIKEEKLNVNIPKDQVKIMKYFNKLYNDKLIFAKESI